MASGINLDAYLRERGPLPPAKAVRVAVEVLGQVQALLANGPSTALSGIGPPRIHISADGRVVLLDPDDEISAAISAPAYASPEEIRGAAPDARSAVYSVGCALFELLTGQPPFAGDGSRKVLDGHLSRSAPDIRSLRPEVPPLLSAAVASFLAKDPAARPQGPSPAIQALRAALGKPAAGAGAQAPAAPAARAPAAAAAAKPAAANNQFGSSMPKSAGQSRGPVGRGPVPVPRAGGHGARQSPGASPMKPLRPGMRPGAAVGRGKLGRSADPEPDSRTPAPAARSPWVFTWFGLLVGVLLCLILVATHAGGAKEPVSIELTQLEKEQSFDRRKHFRRTLDDDNAVASAELERLPSMRLSMADRAEHISKVLDQYPHTAVAPRIAEAISKLRASVEEQASENAGGDSSPAPMSESSLSPGAAPAPEETTEKPEEGKKEESPDDIGAKAGGDDGKKDL